MIDSVLVHIRDILNQYFKNQHGFSDNKVVLSNLLENDGSSPIEVEDRLVFFLLSIGEEFTLKNKSGRTGGAIGTGFIDHASPLYLNLQLVFCANFKNKNYVEGLNYLSLLINFFQNNRIINSSAIQGVSRDIGKISFELCSLSYDSLSHVWSAIGSKILPSAVYKVGLVMIDDTPAKGITPAVKSTGTDQKL